MTDRTKQYAPRSLISEGVNIYKTVLTPLSVTQGTYLCGGLRASVCCAIWCSRLLPRELVEQSRMGFRSIPNCLAHCQSDNVMYIQPTVLKNNSWLN